jgi:hypothetical protein
MEEFPFFVCVKGPNGKRLLINLNVCFGYTERDDGMADVVAITGATMPTGERFDTVLADLAEQKT